jgi:hypothetical protein
VHGYRLDKRCVGLDDGERVVIDADVELGEGSRVDEAQACALVLQNGNVSDQALIYCTKSDLRD